MLTVCWIERGRTHDDGHGWTSETRNGVAVVKVMRERNNDSKSEMNAHQNESDSWMKCGLTPTLLAFIVVTRALHVTCLQLKLESKKYVSLLFTYTYNVNDGTRCLCDGLDLCLNYESKVMGWWYHDMPQIPLTSIDELRPCSCHYGIFMAMCTLSHLFVAPMVQLTSHLELTSDTRSTDFTFQLDQKSKKLFWFFVLLRLRSVCVLSDFKVINSICISWQLEQLIIDLLVDIFPFKLYQSCCDF